MSNQDDEPREASKSTSAAALASPDGHEPSPPRRPRPVRPRNLRARQVVLAPVGTAIATGEPVAVGVPALAAQFELAAVPRRPGAPKRPAHLPSRLHLTSSANSMQTSLGAVASTGSAGKPNRYSWAQMQQWQQAAAAAAAAARDDQAEAGLRAADQRDPQRPDGLHYHFAQPFASAASRVFVVNPIVNLSEHTKSRLVKTIEAVKRFSEKWFSHVLLLLFLAAYACLGAYVFISFEAPTEHLEKQLIVSTKQRIVNESYDQARAHDRQHYNELFQRRFEDYERLLNRVCAAGMTSSSLENQWNFWGALFYSMTVFTTIGYGHLTPITFAGRVATMVYAIFGIPILLMVLADLGKLLTQVIKFAFKKFRWLYNKLLRRKESVRTRKLISDNTNQYIGLARDALERGFVNYIQPYQQRIPGAFRRGGGGGAPQRRPDDSELGEFIPSPGEAGDKSGGALESSEVIVTPGRQTKPVSPQPGQNSAKRSLLPSFNGGGQHQQRHKTPPAARRKISTGSKIEKRRAPVSRSSSSSNLNSSAKQLPSPSSKRSSSTDETSDQTAAAQKAPADPDAKQAAELSDDLKSADEQLDELEQQQQHFQDEQQAHDDEDDFDIPVSFALFLLITYMMFGAVVFSIWEGWNFFDALYFVFISMSTIGFGDLVPQHPRRMVGTFAYLLFGLALTSMCINVVQEKIHATFLRAKMQIGEKMGFDLEQIMADDYYNDAGSAFNDHDDYQQDQELDANSVALSQTNSLHTSDHAPNSVGKQQRPLTLDAELAGPAKQASASRASGKHKWSRKRGSGSDGAGGGGSFRRKSTSNKKQLGKQADIPNRNKQAPDGKAAPQLQPIESQLDVISFAQQESQTDNEPVVINQPVSTFQATCEPLRRASLDKNDQQRRQQLASPSPKPKLASTRSHPIAETIRPEESSAAFFLKQFDNQSQQSNKPRRSLSSSRRASVSHELNQLDDIIVALSRAPSTSSREKFGPLLGIPVARRSNSLAKSSNGTDSLNKGLNCSNQSINTRRATSMMNRSATNSPRPMR